MEVRRKKKEEGRRKTLGIVSVYFFVLPSHF
jgi:hypothetical protein